MILGLAADNKSIKLLKAADPSASYAEFLAELPADDCRYAVLKFDYDAGTDGNRSKLVFFMWYVAPSVHTHKHTFTHTLTRASLFLTLLLLPLCLDYRAPDTSKTKSKMMYAGSKDSIKKALQGIQIEIQGTDASEVSEEEVLNKCKSISK